ncbi:NUDIX domain-containing protein, partial [bacterium]|nr:NUDIX domain-containing protein [bacterium]
VGLDISINKSLCQVKHAYSHFKITLHVYDCDYKSGEASPKTSDEIKWVFTKELEDYPFPTANRKIFAHL